MEHGAVAEPEELRSGVPPWRSPDPELRGERLSASIRVDVAIVGAGITGAMVASALLGSKMSVAVIDRGRPGCGSTAASTALLLWDLDMTLVEIAGRCGRRQAVDIYRRSHAAFTGLRDLIAALGVDCAYRVRPALFLAADESDARASLEPELAARRDAGLPSVFLDRAGLAGGFGVHRPGAFLTPDAAEVDPLALTAGLLRLACHEGARLIEGAAVRYHREGRGALVELDDGKAVEARHVVIATGYDMPDFLKPACHRTLSSWCLATVPQREDRLWGRRALIWEDADPYLYARTTADNRVLVGGEDQPTADAADREALTLEKVARLVAKMKRLWPEGDYSVAACWSAEFGETSDGLPLIGPVPGLPQILAAFGYGGNGITFSYMAGRILAAIIRGEQRPWFADFAIDRETAPFETSAAQGSGRRLEAPAVGQGRTGSAYGS